jgi:hypothetical protein
MLASHLNTLSLDIMLLQLHLHLRLQFGDSSLCFLQISFDVSHLLEG